MNNLPKSVILVTKPDGHASQHYPLTLGSEYKVLGQIGSCAVIETDEPGKSASVHWSRFEPVN